MTRIDEIANRIAELEDLARTEGLTLPMPAGVIALHECAGHVIDLHTGAVLVGGADVRVWPAGGSRTDGGAVTR